MKYSYPFLFYFLLISVLVNMVTGMTHNTANGMETSHALDRQLAQGLQGSAQRAAQGTSASIIPGYATDNPSQSSLNAATMGDVALNEANRLEAGTFLKSATANRQKFTIDPDTDPLLKNGDEVLKDPHTVLDVKMEEGAEERGGVVTLTCEEAGNSVEQVCHHNLNVEIEITPGWVQESWSCRGYLVPWYSDRDKGNGGCVRRMIPCSHGDNNPGCWKNCGVINHVRIEHPEIITIKKKDDRKTGDCSRLEAFTREKVEDETLKDEKVIDKKTRKEGDQ